MTGSKPSWEELNAYVDGELAVTDAAAVARALADDKTLADAVATLSRLKAATQENLEDFALPPALSARRPWRRAALAAALAAAMLIVAVVSYRPWDTGPEPPAWLAAAWQIHDTWKQTEPTAAAAGPDSGLVLATLHRIGPEAFLPDLRDARLTLSRLETLPLPYGGGEVVHAGYLGTRGCQVSLLIVPGGGALSAKLIRFDQGAGRGYAWRAGQTGYLLLAEGMDEARLALLAETVRRASLERQAFDPSARTALQESRKHSAPCLG